MHHWQITFVLSPHADVWTQSWMEQDQFLMFRVATQMTGKTLAVAEENTQTHIQRPHQQSSVSFHLSYSHKMNKSFMAKIDWGVGLQWQSEVIW